MKLPIRKRAWAKINIIDMEVNNMGKYFYNKKKSEDKSRKITGEQIRKGNYIPWKSIESKISNEQMIPTEIRERECYPDYVSDSAKMNKTNQ